MIVGIWGATPTSKLLQTLERQLPEGTSILHSDTQAGSSHADAFPAIDSPLTALRTGLQQGADYVLLVHGECELPALAFERLQKAMTHEARWAVLSALDNSQVALCPFTRNELASKSLESLDRLVFNYSSRAIFPTAHVGAALSLWRCESVSNEELQGSNTLAELAANLIAANHLLAAVDHLFCRIGSYQPPTAAAPAADPLAELRLKLTVAVKTPIPQLAVGFGLEASGVCLHVLHDWGGGVKQWVNDISISQTDRAHLLLVAKGQSGGDCGIRLELTAAQPDLKPFASWSLATPIASTAIADDDYRQILEIVVRRYGVTQIVVSSLIGHSLDCLRTGLPTQVVWHDYYPVWPILNLRLDSATASDFDPTELQRQLDQKLGLFNDKQARHWLKLREEYLVAAARYEIQFIAPSQSVDQGMALLEKKTEQLPVTVIPHGLAAWPEHTYNYRLDPHLKQRKVRVLVPGRISDQKGKQLLTEALPHLREYAEIFLLGAGKDGEDFFGQSGVHVVLQYERDRLPTMLDQLRPDLALLLSTVTETFSYTLSEMESLGVPVVATRVGSLAERLASTPNALVEPTAAAVAKAIAHFTDSDRLATLVKPARQRTLQEMAAAYSEEFPCSPFEALRYELTTHQSEQAERVALIRQVGRLTAQASQLQRQQQRNDKELKQRGEWGYELKQQLAKRTAWAQDLETELQQVQQNFAQLEIDFKERTEWALRLDRELTEQRDLFDQVVNSRSWQLTKPVRFMTRKMRALKQRITFGGKRATTLAKRTKNSLKIRGVKGTLDRIGSELRAESTATDFSPPTVTDIQLEVALSFLPTPNPTASIVIPVFNQFRHTWSCLKSLLEAKNRRSFEVIVVDDESSDETEQRLSKFTGIRVLRNDQNLGFIGSCNRGAAEAKGEFLVLLNNDTAVGDGWLDALLQTFDDRDDAGLVGAKLVYPDGTLQEAGGIVFADGSGWNYGRNEDPGDPQYSFVREVDYCSGACIAIPISLWQQLGGFDARYTPAYYEDTDFAMQVRAVGKRVYFQPHCVVTHFEGVTSGTDTSAGTKRYQVVNQEKFAAKWEAVLRSDHPLPGQPIRAAREHRKQHQALIIDACTPTPDQDSGSLRMTNLMRLLRELGYQVAFLADNRRHEGAYTQALQQQGIEPLFRPWADDAQQLLKQIGASLDLVILSRHYVASQYIDLVRWHCPNAHVLFDTVDLHYLREQRLAKLENDASLLETARQTQREELAVAARCDTTLVVSEHEQKVLATDAPHLNVAVLSNIHQVYGCRRPFLARRDMFFIGGFQHPPNIDAVNWFALEVWPLIVDQLEDVQCYIIGSKAPPAVRQLDEVDGMVFKGFVENIEPYLDGCRLSVAPLRYGAGVKGKVNMSMSYGQPVVATTPAVEGMHVTVGEDVLVGNDPSSFAAAVTRAYQDETVWNQLSSNGLANVEQHFSFAAAQRALRKVLEANR